MRLAALVTTIGLALAGPIACGPTVAGPPSVPIADEISFVVETRGISGRPYVRDVTLTVAALQIDGEIADVVDPTTGATRPGPESMIVKTPFEHVATLHAGVVGISVTVLYRGQAGDYLSCYVMRRGLEIRGSLRQAQVTTPRASGQGVATVICTY